MFTKTAKLLTWEVYIIVELKGAFVVQRTWRCADEIQAPTMKEAQAIAQERYSASSANGAVRVVGKW